MRLPIPVIILLILACRLMPGCAQKYATPPAPISLNAVRLDDSWIKVTVEWRGIEPPLILGISIPYLTTEEYDGLNHIVRPPGDRSEDRIGILIARTVKDSAGSEIFLFNKTLHQKHLGREEFELQAMFLSSIQVLVREDSSVRGSKIVLSEQIDLQSELPRLTLFNPTATDRFDRIPDVRKWELGERGALEISVVPSLTQESRCVIQIK